MFVRIFGVGLPALTLVLELLTHMCGLDFFDPIPTWWHVALVASVPLINLSIWLCISAQRCSTPVWLAHANAFAIGISGAYAALFLPMAPFALIGLIFLLGWLALAPAFAFVASILGRRLCRHLVPADQPLPSLLPGLTAALLALGVPLAWDAFTHGQLHAAASSDAARQQRGVDLLRFAGRRGFLLESCYRAPRLPWDFGSASHLGVPQEKAREVYYRVTGVAFNQVAPPTTLGVGGARGWRAWNWDRALGGTSVANKVPGLSVKSSRIEAQTDAAAANSYMEWTLVFRNIAANPGEARAQIELPPGGVVSRLTLWINGEPQEAAVGARSQVRAAYQEIAVQQRRDPVLVTTNGRDRVLMQCFPVPANGGEMKIRIGITAPLQFTSATATKMLLPRMVETNFEEPDRFAHQLSMPNSGQLRSRHTSRELERHPGVVVTRGAAAADAWTDDPADQNFVIRQRLHSAPVKTPSRIAVVVDGSQLMKRDLRAIAEAIAELPQGAKVALFFAGDRVEAALQQGSDEPAEFASWLRGKRASGGRDNLPALAKAVDFAAEEPGGVLLWIHGPQPVLLSSIDPLLQRFEDARHRPVFHTIAAVSGANAILDRFGSDAVQPLRTGLGAADELRSAFALWSGKSPQYQLHRERVPRAQIEAESSHHANRHLARLWGADEVDRLRADSAVGSLDRAVKLALDLQLVTPVSGAVVLETKEQYERHRLQQVSPTTVPTIPEPNTAALLAGAAVWLMSRRRRTRNCE